ncbi:SRPBCC family protein [Robertkochia flava]|uniref:SRPBCC family protein n=1 Tax=Robertkochia flava TaxID=3447986 RepID=UPI001CCA0D32|nr:SRPBCC family protein [Robertkochia marina]
MEIVFYILLGIALLIMVLNFMAPKTYHVSRSIDIRRPADEVFTYIKYLKNQEEWSPWAEKDPEMETSFFGTDGEVGAKSTWKGNKQVGEGEQEITRISDGEIMESRLRFYKPFKSESDAYIKVTSVNENRSRVTWGFSGENGFPVRIFMLFMNMDKAIGKDFEYGLQNLKNQLEIK